MLNRIAGLTVFILVMTGYALSLGYRGLPPAGHPYLGLALTSVALAQIIDTREHSWGRTVVYGCAIGATLPWLLEILSR